MTYLELWEDSCYEKERKVFCVCGHAIQRHGANSQACYGEGTGTVGMGIKTSDKLDKCGCLWWKEEGMVETIGRIRRNEAK